MNSVKLILAMTVAIFMAVPAFADTVVDDAIKLTQQGVGEDVLVAWAEHQQVGNLSAAEIIHLKESNVPARAIAALIRAGAMNQAPTMPPPGFAQQQVPPQNDQGNVLYTSQAPEATTTYVPSSSTVYYDSYPAYYGYGYPYYGYGYPYYYGGYYYPWWYGPAFGLSFNFGFGGHNHWGGWGGRGGYGGFGGRGGFSGRGGSGVGVGVGVGFSGSRTTGHTFSSPHSTINAPSHSTTTYTSGSTHSFSSSSGHSFSGGGFSSHGSSGGGHSGGHR